jgi:phospholipid/cholesterol/gamma-HCH transport system substrate-binding protein
MRRVIRKHLRDFLALLGMAIVAVGVAGYILANERFRFPLIQEKPQVLKLELSNAQAVIPGQGQTVRVAGVKIGDIGQVQLEDGKAVVDLDIDHEYKGLVRQDATALLRPKTGLKDMFIEVDPGNGRPLPEGGRIQAANTSSDINPDEILSALDSDTRDYLKLLIGGLGKGLKGHGEDLRQTLLRLEPLHRDLAKVNVAIATRRRDLKSLIHDYGSLITELSGKDEQLTRLVGASNQVFSATAAESGNIKEAVRRLPGSLRQTQRTLVKVNAFGQRLGPALEALRPPFRRLDETNAAVRPFVREAEPIVRKRIRPFARAGQPFVRDLGLAAADLSKAAPDLTTGLGELNRLFNLGAYNPGGAESLTGNLTQDRARQEGYLYWLAWTAQNGVSVFSSADAQGVFRRITLCGLSPNDELQRIADATAVLLANPTLAPFTGMITPLLAGNLGGCSF